MSTSSCCQMQGTPYFYTNIWFPTFSCRNCAKISEMCYAGCSLRRSLARRHKMQGKGVSRLSDFFPTQDQSHKIVLVSKNIRSFAVGMAYCGRDALFRVMSRHKSSEPQIEPSLPAFRTYETVICSPADVAFIVQPYRLLRK